MGLVIFVIDIIGIIDSGYDGMYFDVLGICTANAHH